MAKSKLINVRLDPADAAKAAELQKRGVKLSSLVRNAVRSEYEQLQIRRRRGSRDVRAMLQAIYDKYPIPDEARPPVINTADRKVMSKRISDVLKSKQRVHGATPRHQRHRRSA